MVATAKTSMYPFTPHLKQDVFKMDGGHYMFFPLRVLILVAVLWLLWRLCASRFGAQRQTDAHSSDDWTEVLESIKALPETRRPPRRSIG